MIVYVNPTGFYIQLSIEALANKFTSVSRHRKEFNIVSSFTHDSITNDPCRIKRFRVFALLTFREPRLFFTALCYGNPMKRPWKYYTLTLHYLYSRERTFYIAYTEINFKKKRHFAKLFLHNYLNLTFYLKKKRKSFCYPFKLLIIASLVNFK